MDNPTEALNIAQTSQRKPYSRPQVEQVRLVLSEAVLGTGCKTTTSAGSSEPCEVNFVNCVQAGS